MVAEPRPAGSNVSDEEGEGGVDDDGDNYAGEDDDQEDDKVQRKLHLFQCRSVQQSIKRLWDLLPKDENGELVMEGYVELNLRFQKCLTQEFILERAIDSAIGDWGEDVHEGRRSMSAEEFAMFLFELCSLWCGPSVSLLVYLLFLNATFIAITDARGAHTVGLRPLTTVERLPQPFFDLLSVQGWARQPEDAAGLDEDEALHSWFVRNLSPECEQATRLQVQRQVFQVTHDVRSVLLFQEGDKSGEGALDLVKLASKRLVKVAPVDVDALGRSVATATGLPSTAPSATTCDLWSQPWCPPLHNKAPSVGLPPDPQAPLMRKIDAKPAPAQRRACSQPGRTGEQTLSSALALGDWQPRRVPASGQRLPRGRAYDTRLTRPPASGLVLAGQATMSAAAAAASEIFDARQSRGTRDSVVANRGIGESLLPLQHDRGILPDDIEGGSYPLPDMAGSSASASHPPTHIPGASSTVNRHSASSSSLHADMGNFDTISVGSTASAPLWRSSRDAPLKPLAAPKGTPQESRAGSKLRASFAEPDSGWNVAPDHQVQLAASSLIDTPASGPYKLPRHPTGLYQQQTDPLVKLSPESIVFACQQWQSQNPLVNAPFERVLRKLPPNVRPSSVGPTVGPLKHPNEPIWFEMVHRLQGILKKQGRRADRRRKRRLRSKLFRGKARNAPTKRDEGKELREYLDRHKAEFQDEPLQQVGGAGVQNPGEFLGKVHERYLINRERVESRPFFVRGPGTSFAGKKGIGDMVERKKAVVRPIYCPPPPSSMAGR